MSGVAAALTRHAVLDADKTALCKHPSTRAGLRLLLIGSAISFSVKSEAALERVASARRAPIIKWIARHAPVCRHSRLQRTSDARAMLMTVARVLPNVSKEIIVVDDCSKDGTREWLKANFVRWANAVDR